MTRDQVTERRARSRIGDPDFESGVTTVSEDPFRNSLTIMYITNTMCRCKSIFGFVLHLRNDNVVIVKSYGMKGALWRFLGNYYCLLRRRVEFTDLDVNGILTFRSIPFQRLSLSSHLS